MQNTLVALILIAGFAGLLAWCCVTFNFWWRHSQGKWWGYVAWMASMIGAPVLGYGIYLDLLS